MRSRFPPLPLSSSLFFFFFNDTATTEIYTLSLHDALPIYRALAAVSTAVSGDLRTVSTAAGRRTAEPRGRATGTGSSRRPVHPEDPARSGVPPLRHHGFGRRDHPGRTQLAPAADPAAGASGRDLPDQRSVRHHQVAALHLERRLGVRVSGRAAVP